MVEGKTTSGFEFKCDERIVEDWRLVEAITDTESSDASIQLIGIRNLIELVLGADESARLKNHIAKQNEGFIPTTMIEKEVTEIITALKENAKN